MINITREELNKLERIGAGNFGTIYLKENKAYKIYHEMVKTEYHTLHKNPSLKYRKHKLNRLIKLDKKLTLTDLVQDVIFVDGKFGGVVMPYYDGDTLIKTKEDPLKNKIEIAKKLIESSKELTEHHIYPMDYKLNNIMLVSGEIKLIDLDDFFTKITLLPHPSLKRETIFGLDETIKAYFYDSNFFPLKNDLRKYFSKEILLANSEYQEIEQYIAKKSEAHNYIFINENIDFNRHFELLRNPNYRIVYVYYRFCSDYMENIIYNILNSGIKLYDLIPMYNFKKYLRSIEYDECLGIKKDEILNLKRKL